MNECVNSCMCECPNAGRYEWRMYVSAHAFAMGTVIYFLV